MLSTLQSLAHLGQPVQVGTQPVSLQPGYNLNQIIIRYVLLRFIMYCIILVSLLCRPGVQLTSGPLISNVPIASKPVDGQVTLQYMVQKSNCILKLGRRSVFYVIVVQGLVVFSAAITAEQTADTSPSFAGCSANNGPRCAAARDAES